MNIVNQISHMKDQHRMRVLTESKRIGLSISQMRELEHYLRWLGPPWDDITVVAGGEILGLEIVLSDTMFIS